MCASIDILKLLQYLFDVFRLLYILSLKEKQEQQLLNALPPPTLLQIEAIGIAVQKVVEEFGLNDEDVEQRLGIKTTMENIFQPKLPGCCYDYYT